MAHSLGTLAAEGRSVGQLRPWQRREKREVPMDPKAGRIGGYCISIVGLICSCLHKLICNKCNCIVFGSSISQAEDMP